MRELCVAEVSEALWQKMVDNGLPGATADLNGAHALKKKQVCKELMQQWCPAIASNQGDGFEQSWGFSRSKKRARGHGPVND